MAPKDRMPQPANININVFPGGSLGSGFEDLVAGIGRKTVGNILQRQDAIKSDHSKIRSPKKIDRAVVNTDSNEKNEADDQGGSRKKFQF